MTAPDHAVYRFGEFELDVPDRRLRRNGADIALTPKAFDTLRFLVERRGRVVTKEELRAELWPDVTVDDNALPQNISRVRKALGGAPLVETVSGIGYRFLAEVADPHDAPEVVPPAPVSGSRRWLWFTLLGLAVIAGFLLFWPRPKPTDEFAGVDAVARESYIRGRAIWGRRETAEHPEAETYLLEAVRHDPKFAMGWVGLADYYAVGPPPQPRAWDAVSKALLLNPKLGEAWSSAGFYKMTHEWDWHAAETNLRRGAELAPTYEYGRKWLGELFSITGRPSEAVAELEVAVRHHPESASARVGLCRVLYFAGRLDDAAKHCRIALDVFPSFSMAHQILYCISMDRGKTEDAVIHWLSAGSMSFADERNAYVKVYRKSGAEAMFRSVTEAPGENFYSKADLAARLGDSAAALTWLEMARDRHDFMATWTNANPAFAKLRDQPRFRAIVRSMGL